MREIPIGSELEWSLSEVYPPDWGERVVATSGGFFQSPLGLQVGAPSGVPIYCTLRSGSEVLGVALGVLSRCRLALVPRHIYFPSLPALPRVQGSSADTGRWRAGALDSLVEALGERGGAEVVFDSFDARWAPNGSTSGVGSARAEFVVGLHRGPDQVLAGFSASHRRHYRRGEREGWIFRQLSDRDARAALMEVMESASGRARQRGRPYIPVVPTLEDQRSAPVTGGDWELNTFVALAGEELLAAVLVGVAAGRGFYVMGGSTPEGYRRHTAVWLHFRVMQWLWGRGSMEYNLGGTPSAAVDPAAPGHGLFRFKSQFGSEVVTCRGIRQVLRPVHQVMHRLASRIGG